MQQFAATQYRANPQAGGTSLFGVDICLRDGDHLVHRQTGFTDDQTRHQFGQRCNRQDGLVVLAVQDLARILINHQGDAGFQGQ